MWMITEFLLCHRDDREEGGDFVTCPSWALGGEWESVQLFEDRC